MDKNPASRRMLASIGDFSRFYIVGCLGSGSLCVTELANLVGLSQSCTTRHLQALAGAGIVRGTRDGKRVIYTLCMDEPRVASLVSWLRTEGHEPIPASPPPAETEPEDIVERPRPRPSDLEDFLL